MIDFIEESRGSHGVEPICRALQFAPSTYYDRRAIARDPDRASVRARSDAALSVKIDAAWEDKVRRIGNTDRDQHRIRDEAAFAEGGDLIRRGSDDADGDTESDPARAIERIHRDVRVAQQRGRGGCERRHGVMPAPLSRTRPTVSAASCARVAIPIRMLVAATLVQAVPVQ